jgi:hypothetical protein
MPQRRASYSAMLFDTGKCRRTVYLMCSPRGEMKSRCNTLKFLDFRMLLGRIFKQQFYHNLKFYQ